MRDDRGGGGTAKVRRRDGFSPPGARRILVIRNDRLGDFMLAWPSFALLKASLPEARVVGLVPSYTAELAQACPSLDGIVLDPGRGSGSRAALGLARRIREFGFDSAIALFSTGRIAMITRAAGIPYRLAPATKAAQLLYTRRVRQRRSRSLKPEWDYNLDLVHAYLRDAGIPAGSVEPPFLRFPVEETARLRAAWCQAQGIPADRALVFLHPGSGGSAPNLTPERFAELAASLHLGRPVAVVVTAGPAEQPLADEVLRSLAERGVTAGLLHSTSGLVAFARHLGFADLFVSGSTGPLHIAGALDCPTVAFYPRIPVASQVRWQTVNSPFRRLAFEPPEGAAPDAMEAIDLAKAAERVSRWFPLAETAGPGARDRRT